MTSSIRKKFDKFSPYLYILAAMACFWAGSYFRPPMDLQHKVIAATDKEEGSPFEGSKIFVVRHDKSGAFGLITNKDGYGGPVGTDEIFTLHSIDVMPEGSKRIGDTGLAYAKGDAVAPLDKKPEWSKVVKGYAGWSGDQLDREVRRGNWTVYGYKRALLED